jgi:hypothetical protein
MRDYRALMMIKMNHYFHLHHHPEPVPASTLEVEPTHATTSSTAAVEASRIEGGSSLSGELSLTFRRDIHLSRSYVI